MNRHMPITPKVLQLGQRRLEGSHAVSSIWFEPGADAHDDNTAGSDRVVERCGRVSVVLDHETMQDQDVGRSQQDVGRRVGTEVAVVGVCLVGETWPAVASSRSWHALVTLPLHAVMTHGGRPLVECCYHQG